MGNPRKLKLHGKPFDFSPVSPGLANIKKFLDGQPRDELLTTPDLLSGLKISIHMLNKYAARELTDYYHTCHGRNRFWGNRETITELRRQLGAL